METARKERAANDPGIVPGLRYDKGRSPLSNTAEENGS
jgi:hypothetical protein